jgi:hypothetical protein
MTFHIEVNRRGQEPLRALVDECDWRALGDAKWHLGGASYVSGRVAGRRVYLHREVLGLVPGDGLEADHINGDKLDNRRENLRIVRRAENCQNRHTARGPARRRGVALRRDGRWGAFGHLNRRQHWLGTYDTPEEAAAVAASWRSQNMPYSQEAAS